MGVTPRIARGASSAGSLWGGLRTGALVLLDSAPIIYTLEKHPEFMERFRGLLQAYADGAVRIAISTVTVAEVISGPLRHGHDVVAKRYEKELAAFEVVPVSLEIAITAARLRATPRLRLHDALIAATALEIGAAALVTHDRDFSRLEGLRILTGDG